MKKSFALSLLLLLSLNLFPKEKYPLLTFEKIRLAKEESVIIFPKNGTNAFVIAVHGLNLKPSKMNDIIKPLVENGAFVLRLSLSGHKGDIEELKRLTAAQLMSDVDFAYNEAKEYAKEYGIPVYCLGFSLGALTLGSYFSSIDEHIVEKAVYFSPAFTPHLYTRSVKLFSIFGRSFVLPSFSDASHKLYPGTSVSAYLSLFEHVRGLKERGYKNMNIETLLVVNKKDELVSVLALKEDVERFGLSNFRFYEAIVESTFKSRVEHHLLVIPDYMSVSKWENLVSDVSLFFFD